MKTTRRKTAHQATRAAAVVIHLLLVGGPLGLAGRPAAADEANPVETATVNTGLVATALELPAELPPPSPVMAAPRTTVAPRPLADWRVIAAVAGCFAVLVAVRFLARRQTMPLPPDVFEVLGAAPLAGQHAVRIVRFGPKTLLVGVSNAGCTTLAEITDPQATACIAAACRGVQPPRPPRSGVEPPAAGLRRVATACLLGLLAAAPAHGDDASPAEVPPLVTTDTSSVAVERAHASIPMPAPEASPTGSATDSVRRLLGPDAVAAILPSALLFGVVSLAPAVLLMTTCFVRISVVLAFLRQGLGAAQIPSNQILAALAIFLSALVMWPVWAQAWREGVEPFREGAVTPVVAFERGSLPVRRWMAMQIEAAGNRDTMLLFLSRHPAGPRSVASYDDVPIESLLPAFLVSELETAFAIGFRLLLPFVVLDLLVATLVVSTGLVMLPPTLVSLPLKLLVFIAADGWTLVVQTLLDGVRIATS
jgi:flagellar biosynthetic protein FliP